MAKFEWKRFGGYECSSLGDSRFSAFRARLKDGRTIEQTYQCDVKGYQPGGINWRLGKGKPPLDLTIDLFQEYLLLWKQWARYHSNEMHELWAQAVKHNNILSDRFANTRVNQAHALATILTELTEGEFMASRNDVLNWCVNYGADFKNEIYPPPTGWMWVKEGDELILTAVFTMTEDAADISFQDVSDFKTSLPPFLTQKEAEQWVEDQEISLSTLWKTAPPSGWYFMKSSDCQYFLLPVYANLHWKMDM